MVVFLARRMNYIFDKALLILRIDRRESLWICPWGAMTKIFGSVPIGDVALAGCVYFPALGRADGAESNRSAFQSLCQYG